VNAPQRPSATQSGAHASGDFGWMLPPRSLPGKSVPGYIFTPPVARCPADRVTARGHSPAAGWARPRRKCTPTSRSAPSCASRRSSSGRRCVRTRRDIYPARRRHSISARLEFGRRHRAAQGQQGRNRQQPHGSTHGHTPLRMTWVALATSRSASDIVLLGRPPSGHRRASLQRDGWHQRPNNLPNALPSSLFAGADLFVPPAATLDSAAGLIFPSAIWHGAPVSAVAPLYRT
jgi:hypothetical protein